MTFAVHRSGIQLIRLLEVQEGRLRLSDFEQEHLPDNYEECAQLITENAVYSCGAAAEELVPMRDDRSSIVVERFSKQCVGRYRCRE